MYTDLFKNPDVPFDVSFPYMSAVAAELLSFAPMLLSDAGAANSPQTTMATTKRSRGSNSSGHDSNTNSTTPGWLLTRAHWADSQHDDIDTVYWLVAVSDGTAGGPVTFDFSSVRIGEVDCKTQQLQSVTPLVSSAASITIDGCTFTDLVPVLGVRIYNVTGLTSDRAHKSFDFNGAQLSRSVFVGPG